MNTTRIMAVAALIVASGLTLYVARAQQPGIKRTDLQRHDLSFPGREVIQARVEFDPGVSFPKHRHPGEEIIYVLEGSLEYQVEGKPPVTLKAGDVLFIPARTTLVPACVSRRSSSRPSCARPSGRCISRSNTDHWINHEHRKQRLSYAAKTGTARTNRSRDRR